MSVLAIIALIAGISALIAGISLGVTVVVLLIRGGFQLGKLVSQVETQGAKIDNLEVKMDNLEAKFDAKFDALEAKFDARFDTLTAAIGQLQDEMRQTNQILVGLANHTHDADGRTVFTIPS